MKNIIFIVGNREISFRECDLNLKGGNEEYKYIDPKSIRIGSKKVLDNINKYKDKIKINIIPSVLDFYKDDDKEITLIYTNQDDRKVNYQDTIYIANIIAKILGKMHKINTIEFKGNPTDFEQCFKFFSDKLKELSQKYKDVVFCNSGGTPMMKLSILFLLNELDIFDEYEIVQVSDKTNEVTTIPKNSYIKIALLKKEIKSLIESFSYNPAINVMIKYLKQYYGNNAKFKEFKLLLDYASARISFNFIEANKKARQLGEKYVDLYIQDTIEPEFLFNEIYINMLIKLNNREYADFYARAYAFDNNMLYYLFDKKFGTDLFKLNVNEKSKNVLDEEFKLFLCKSQEYLRIISDNKWEEKPTRKVLLTLLEIEESLPKNYKKFSSRLENRNKMYIAHGFRAATMKPREINNFKNELKEIMEYCKFDTYNMFENINKKLIKLLNEL